MSVPRSSSSSPGSAGASPASCPRRLPAATAMQSFCWVPRVTEQLTIVRLGHRGDGIADTQVGPVFVPYTLPGETVTVEAVPGHPDRRHLLHVDTPSHERTVPCLLYTSDAADDLLCVDLGGRRV